VVVGGLRRRVGGRWLLAGVDLTVPVGARLLVVSQPNASASLLLRVLAGLARPAAGHMLLAGLARADDSARGWARRVAYVGPEGGVYPWLSPLEVLTLTARLAGYDRREGRERVEAAIEAFRLGAGLDRPVSRGGQALAQRTALAAAMLPDPEVILLDEPLRALDATERHRLLTLPGRRRTLLLASRYPTSEAGIVNQVALLRDGRVAAHVAVEELERRGLSLSLRGIEALLDEPRVPTTRATADAG
jgi:ABC-type multidrug transport system ATPase subunit